MSIPPLIDTHAHLDSGQFKDDLPEVLGRAQDSGISEIITIGCDLESSFQSVKLAKENVQIHAAVGIHPHDAQTLDNAALERLFQLAQDPCVVAIGEIGLDYYRDRAPRDIQRHAFRQQISLAKELKLPIIVHNRQADADAIAILQAEGADEVGGVMHCFSGGEELAQECLKLGFFISFAGPLTYPNNNLLRQVAANIPTEHLLVETDCPYLAPQGYRGKRNEPSHVRMTAETLAKVKGLSIEDISRITRLNSWRLFGIGAVDQSTRIAYRIRDALYLNITNRCTNACRFCAKQNDFFVKGHQLKLEAEPNLAEIKNAVGDPTRYSEVVFCGYGEPLLRLDLVKEVAAWLKDNRIRVRINTDGQANLVFGRNIIPELKGLVDCLSVSLNAADAETYQNWCCSAFGPEGYQSIKDFLLLAKKDIPQVIASAVTLPGVDMEACRKLAGELGVEFRERIYNEVG